MPSVAIIGASNDPQKFGHAAVLAFRDAGWEVWPVHPRETVIEDLPVFRTIADVPGTPDWISLYVPPKVGLGLLPELQKTGAQQIWFNPGSESNEIIETAKAMHLIIITACSIRAIGKNPANYF